MAAWPRRARSSIRTEIPGPRSRSIIERKERAVADPLSLYLPIVAAEGAWRDAHRRRRQHVHRLHGRRRLPRTSATPTRRSSRPCTEQAARFLHTDFTIVPYEVYVTLAERLGALAPFSGPAKAAFFNAGAEAVENAVKFARAYTGRPAVIGFEGALPRPDAARADAHLEDAPVQGGARPVRARGLPRRRSRTPTAASRPRTRSRRSERAFVDAGGGRDGGGDRARAGAGRRRLHPAPQVEFVAGRARSSATEHGIVLVADEVQTGFGRTGRMFAIEHYGVEPDLITVAKSIAAGLPLSGVLGKAEIMDAPGRRRGRRHVRRQPGRAGGGARRARRDRGGRPRRAVAADRRDDARADARLAGALRRDRRRPRARRDARDRVRRGPRRPAEPAPQLASRGRRGGRSSAACCCSRPASTELHPGARARSSITDAELDEALGVWEEALEAALA